MRNHKTDTQRSSRCTHHAAARSWWERPAAAAVRNNNRGIRALQEAAHDGLTRATHPASYPGRVPSPAAPGSRQPQGGDVKARAAGSSQLQRPWWPSTATPQSQAPRCPHSAGRRQRWSPHRTCVRTARAEAAAANTKAERKPGWRGNRCWWGRQAWTETSPG